MGPISAEGKDPSWTRDQFNVRLTKRRRRQLAAVAAAMAPGASAVDAIDRALDLALSSGSRDDGERIDGIEEILRLLGGRTDAGLASVAGEVRRLRELISAVAQETEHGGALPLREWLESALVDRGMRAARSAIVRATWSSKSRRYDGLLSLEFATDLISVDGAAVPPGGEPGHIFLDGIGDGHVFAELDRHRQVLLRCSPAPGGGWTIAAFTAHSIGTPVSPLGTIRI
jgi:hypothetical protein